MRRMLPMPVPGGNFAVELVFMPSSVTSLVTTVFTRTMRAFRCPQPEVISRKSPTETPWPAPSVATASAALPIALMVTLAP